MTEPTVDAVLAGAESYNDLDEAGQAVVRAAWETRDTQLLAALDFTVTCPIAATPTRTSARLPRAHSTHLTRCLPAREVRS